MSSFVLSVTLVCGISLFVEEYDDGDDDCGYVCRLGVFSLHIYFGMFICLCYSLLKVSLNLPVLFTYQMRCRVIFSKVRMWVMDRASH